MELSKIKQFYCGQKILITGVSGFIGKVLLWKLLHSCSSVDTIYVLIRPKRGQAVQTRVEDILKTIIYDDIRKSNPDVLKKVTAIAGDISLDGLGLSDSDKNVLIEQVTVIFHIAAALNMEADLKNAVNMNTMGTLRMLKLASQMKNLEAFVHTSTAYCYCEQEITEEKVFDPSVNPYDMIHLTNWMSPDLLKLITPGLIKPHPNTYTYTKRLAEKIVSDYYPQLPVVIARPSIVIPSLREPVRGWVDNINGPVGLLIAAGKGVCRSMLCDGSSEADMVSVDIVCNSLLAVAWRTSTQMKENKPYEIPVLNITTSEMTPLLWGEIIEVGREAIHQYPFSQILWYPGGGMTMNKFSHEFTVLFFQLAPAYIIDSLITLFGQKPFLVRVQHRIQQGAKVLQYFTMRRWKFSTSIMQLKESMTESDKEEFCVTMKGFGDRLDFMISAIQGSKRYVLREDMSSLPQNRIKMKIMYIIDCVLRFLVVVFLFWSIFTILGNLSSSVPLF